MPAPGLKRLAAVVVAAAREAVSSTMGYVLIALLFTGLLAGLLPHGCLGTTMRHDNWLSPLLMTAIALPLYSGPLQGMMRLGLMFEHGNSVGAAFALFELGIGINLGLIVWLMTLFGWRRVLAWLAFICAVTLVLAYAAEQPLYFAHEEAGHTHAFDEWTNPFSPGSPVAGQIVRDNLLQKIGVLEPVALGGLTLLVLFGLALRKFDPLTQPSPPSPPPLAPAAGARGGGEGGEGWVRGRVEAFLVKQPPPSDRPVAVWNRNVPGPVLGLVALLGLVVFSVVALYIYYQAPKEAFEEIVRVRASAMAAVISGHKEEAIRQIQQWDLLTRKLQVGMFIRTGQMDPVATQATEELREWLEKLRDALLANDLAGARKMLPDVEKAYRRCRLSYPTDPGSG